MKNEIKIFLIICMISNIRNSYIYLLIQGNGTQRILSNVFRSTPSEVLVNGVKDNTCSKTCNLKNEINNITLKFTPKISSCHDMFSGANNMTEIDLSNFDFSRVTDLSFMFNACINLVKIEFGNINTPIVETMWAMFQSCSKLKSIDLSKFDTSKVKDMSTIFNGCSSLEKIVFGNINTSSLENMETMFQSCYSLISIDLSKFDTSKVTNMGNMFGLCSKLETIEFGNINTSSVKVMGSLFRGCSKLVSIDLSKFDTSNAKNMASMFYNCKNLKYLDLSNFDTSKVTTINAMFEGCSSLIYLNLKPFKLNNLVIKDNAFKGKSSNTKYCIEDKETQEFLIEIISDCSNDCFKDNAILDFEKKKCTISCTKYEFEGLCYGECPKDTYPLFCYENECGQKARECLNQLPLGYYLDLYEKAYKKCFEKCESCYGEGNETNNNCRKCKSNFNFINDLNDNNCYEKCKYFYYVDEYYKYHCTSNNMCPKQYNKIILNKTKCTNNCKNDTTYKYEYNNTCLIECPNETLYNENDKICYNFYIKQNNFSNNNISKEEIVEDFDDFRRYIYIYNVTNDKEDIIEIKNDMTYQLTTTDNQKNNIYNNISKLDLGECEKELKIKYGINDSLPLIIFKIDYFSPDTLVFKI